MNKLTWQERVADTAKAHKRFLLSNPKHSQRDTAELLRRSIGSVNEDLTIHYWTKTHPKILEMNTIDEVLKFIREKKLELKLK